MKTNQRVRFNRIAAWLTAVFLVMGMPISAYAVPGSDVFQDVEGTEPSVVENAVLSGSENYTYSPPSEGEFLIESVSGVLTIANSIPSISFGEYTVSFPTFDYYKIVDTNGNTRFYQADVLKDLNQINGFAYIALYSESETTYFIHVNYMAEAEDKMYNIKAPLSVEQFRYFEEDAFELCLGTDEISERLKDSERIHTLGSFANQNTNVNNTNYNSSASAYALNPIVANSYDSYTNSDGIINTYVSNYFGNYRLENGTITDDPIVNIIPKELCFILGEHIYVGKEYGFFIRVKVDTLEPDDYAVDILVFDIECTPISIPTNYTGIVRVEPLFQFKYRAAETANFAADVDPTLTTIVVPHIQYEYAKYFLKDVGIKYTVENPTILNVGDNGYDPYEDDGVYLFQSRLNIDDTALSAGSGNLFVDALLFGASLIPGVGNAMSVAAYACDLYNGFINQNYFYTERSNVWNNEENIITIEPNSTDQIVNHGNLVKSLNTQIICNDHTGLLLTAGEGDYVESRFLGSRKSGSNYNKVRITTSVSVSVIECYRAGLYDEVYTNFGRATGTYDTGTYKLVDNITLNGYASTIVPANTQTNIVRIVPKVSGSYKIFTSSSTGDPHFRITNATKGTAANAAEDDISATNKNATMTIDLIAGDVYYIEAYHNEAPREYTLHIGYNPASTQTLVLNRVTPITTTGNSYKMLKFTPTTSGYYDFTTNKTSGDPQMFLFSAGGVLLNSDDDSGGSYNAYFDHYLVAGTTYYLAIQGYNGAATTCSIHVVKS